MRWLQKWSSSDDQRLVGPWGRGNILMVNTEEDEEEEKEYKCMVRSRKDSGKILESF